MTLVIVLAFLAIGWQLARYFALQDRLAWSMPLSAALTSVVFQVLWFAGVPFAFLAWLWWFLAGISMAAVWIDQVRPELWKARISFLRDSLARISTYQLSWERWPLPILAAVASFSLGLILVWSFTVRPVSWDNLTLYQGRATLIAQGAELADIRREFVQVDDGRTYDFLHPFGSSLMLALFSWSGSEFGLAWQGVFFVSILAIGWKKLKTPESKVVWIFLLTSVRFFFERAVEGYPSWIAALFWLAAFLEFPQRNQDWEGARVARVTVMISAALGWRVTEPFFIVFLASLGMYAIQSFLIFRTFSFRPLVVVLLPSLVAWQWQSVMSWGRSIVGGPQITYRAELLNNVGNFHSEALKLLFHFPLWSFGVLTLCLLVLMPRRWNWMNQRFISIIFWMGCLGLVLAAPLAQGALTTFPHGEIIAIWPRLAVAPALFSVWICSQLIDAIVQLKE